jgi:hypothetical protein
MADYKRPLHRRLAGILERMDPRFLESARCFFGGGTHLVMSRGEFRESRDIDFLVSSQAGLRMLRETINERSLGKLFKAGIHLVREVRADGHAIRTYIAEAPGAEPIKFEILVEGRIELRGALDPTLGVPCLEPPWAIGEKLLANADRGRAKEHRSRDVIDLAFVSLDVEDAAFIAGYELAEQAYGKAVLKELDHALKMLELDSKYRAQCVSDLLIEDAKALRKGLEKLRRLKRVLRKHAQTAIRTAL